MIWVLVRLNYDLRYCSNVCCPFSLPLAKRFAFHIFGPTTFVMCRSATNAIRSTKQLRVCLGVDCVWMAGLCNSKDKSNQGSATWQKGRGTTRMRIIPTHLAHIYDRMWGMLCDTTPLHDIPDRAVMLRIPNVVFHSSSSLL